MKKVVLLFLVCIVALSMSVTASGESAFPETIETDEYIQDMCWIGDTLYILSNCTVYRWQPGGKELTVFWQSEGSRQFCNITEKPEDEADCLLWELAFNHVFTDGESLFAWQERSGQLFCLDGGKEVPAAVIPQDILVYEDYGEEYYRALLQAEMQGDELLLLFASEDPDNQTENTLIACDIHSGNTRIIFTGCARSFVPAGEGRLLLNEPGDKAGESVIRLIHTENGQETGTGEVIPFASGYSYINAAFYREELLICEAGKLTACSMDGKERTVAYANGGKPLCNSDGLCAIADEKYIYFRDLKNPIEKKELHIIGEADSDILREYNLQNSDISIVCMSNDNEMIERVALTGDDAADLYVLDVPGDFTAMMEKGYLAPLDDPSTVSMTADYYTGIKDAITSKDGLLYGFPTMIYTDTWCVNDESWNTVNPGDIPVTYADLLDYLRRWNDEYADTWPDYTPLGVDASITRFVRMVIEEYIERCGNEVPDFTSPAVRDVIHGFSIYRELLEDVRKNAGEDSIPLINEDDMEFGLNFRNDEYRYRTIRKPTISADDEPFVKASLTVLAINVHSLQKEEAMQFIRFYAEHQNPVLTCMLSSEMNTPMRKNDYEERRKELEEKKEKADARLAQDGEQATSELKKLAEDTDKELKKLEDEWLISPVSIADYRQAVPRIIVPYDSYLLSNPLVSDEIEECVESFCEEGLPEEKLDTFLNRLNRICQMAIMESK